ncbi:MAG: hypothetical protein HN524_13730 [Verrucomicrobia bacterium]|nr:hypothetical protein [Verrucomicrobiota bacterium]
MKPELKPNNLAPLFCAALLIFGCSKSNHAADNTPKGPPAAVKTSFEAVAARLDPNGHLYAYVNTVQALAMLDETLESLISMAKNGTEAVGGGLMDNPFVAPIVEGVLGVVEPAFRKSGVGEISGVGMSSLAIEENLWHSKMFVHHQPSKGSGLIWDMFGEQPHTFDVLSLAPDNTAALAHSDLNVKRVIDWADAVFGEMLGGESIMANAPPQVQDILDSFGNEAGFLMTLDSENKMTLPGFMFDREEDLELDGVAFALLLRVNDDMLMEMLGEAMGGGFGAPEGTKVGGVTIHSIPLPIPLPIKMDLSPCYFQVGNYMVLSSAESLAKRMAEAHGGKGRLVDDAGFKALAKGLSLKANGIYYADPQASEWGLEINELGLNKLDGALAKVYEIYKKSMQQGVGMVSLFKVQEDGLLIEGNSTVNPYGGNIVHSIAGVGVAVASSLNDLQQSGLFEDLGGFGGPPGFDGEPDFDLPDMPPNLPRVDPPQLPGGDMTVTMRVNPTSADSAGHTRTETGVGDLSDLYFFSSGAFSFDEIRIGKTYDSVVPNDSIELEDLIFYEGFDYEHGSALTEQGGWYQGGRISRRSDNYTIRQGSLNYPRLSTTGNHGYAASSETMSGVARNIPPELLENNGGKIFASFLMQPEGVLHEGIYEGYFILCLETDQGKEIGFGKSGEGGDLTKSNYVSELRGGKKQIDSGVPCEIEKTALIVLEISANKSALTESAQIAKAESQNLSGKWLGKGYKCWGNLDEDGQPLILDEIILVSQDGDKVVATKITGDECVKAGEKTWEGKISGDWIEGVAYGRSQISPKLNAYKTRIKIKSNNLLYLDTFGLDAAIEFERIEDDVELDLKNAIVGFYQKYEIDEADRLTKDQILQIAQGKDDRSNIPEEFSVFHIKDKELTANLTFSSPEGENPWKMPEHHGIHKFVDGKYYIWDKNVPEEQGAFDRVLTVIALSKNKTYFVAHEIVKSELRSLGIGKVTGKSQVEWTGSAVLEEPKQGSLIMDFKTTEQCSDNKNTMSVMSYINGEPWFRIEGTITKK